MITSSGGLAVLPDTSPLLHSATFTEALLGETAHATIRFGERPRTRGLHVMQSPSMRWVETLSGLGGAGINLILAWRPACAGPPPGHPMVPTYVLSISGVAGDAPRWSDLVLPLDRPTGWLASIAEFVKSAASGARVANSLGQGNVDFQIPRAGAVSL